MLVNNAGTAIPKLFEEATLEEMDRVIDLNLRGVFIATQAALRRLGDGGRIISRAGSSDPGCQLRHSPQAFEARPAGAPQGARP